ncbi:MAG TPA: twin-arginine translocase TatA/TatE family subunit [Alphaproteobacteria bacterium]|nr:twin-arginine translocase TatA/TatE family subunit [Alphaproteobacteria bacterium]
MFGLGFQELLVILIMALLFFGGNKLPEVGGALGKAIREFQRAAKEPTTIDLRPRETAVHQPTENDTMKERGRG